ncbi:putative JmjC domain-containing histone demethylation protein 2C isoform X2 [Glandiceps talaboti]
MGIEPREELVGKRFLFVSSSTKLKLSKIEEWDWRAGRIRAVDNWTSGQSNPDLAVYVEFEEDDWDRREWIRPHDSSYLVFVVEKSLVWGQRMDPFASRPGNTILWPALTFQVLEDKVGLQDSKKVPLEFCVDRKLEFVQEDETRPYEDDDDGLQPALRYDEVRDEVNNWTHNQKVQQILMKAPYSLTGYRVQVYRLDSRTQWFSAVITGHDLLSRDLQVMDDTVLESHSENPAHVQMMFLDDVVNSLLKGENVGITSRRRTLTSSSSNTQNTSSVHYSRSSSRQSQLQSQSPSHTAVPTSSRSKKKSKQSEMKNLQHQEMEKEKEKTAKPEKEPRSRHKKERKRKSSESVGDSNGSKTSSAPSSSSSSSHKKQKVTSIESMRHEQLPSQSLVAPTSPQIDFSETETKRGVSSNSSTSSQRQKSPEKTVKHKKFRKSHESQMHSKDKTTSELTVPSVSTVSSASLMEQEQFNAVEKVKEQEQSGEKKHTHRHRTKYKSLGDTAKDKGEKTTKDSKKRAQSSRSKRTNEEKSKSKSEKGKDKTKSSTSIPETLPLQNKDRPSTPLTSQQHEKDKEVVQQQQQQHQQQQQQQQMQQKQLQQHLQLQQQKEQEQQQLEHRQQQQVEQQQQQQFEHRQQQQQQQIEHRQQQQIEHRQQQQQIEHRQQQQIEHRQQQQIEHRQQQQQQQFEHRQQQLQQHNQQDDQEYNNSSRDSCHDDNIVIIKRERNIHASETDDFETASPASTISAGASSVLSKREELDSQQKQQQPQQLNEQIQQQQFQQYQLQQQHQQQQQQLQQQQQKHQLQQKQFQEQQLMLQHEEVDEHSEVLQLPTSQPLINERPQSSESSKSESTKSQNSLIVDTAEPIKVYRDPNLSDSEVTKVASVQHQYVHGAAHPHGQPRHAPSPTVTAAPHPPLRPGSAHSTLGSSSTTSAFAPSPMRPLTPHQTIRHPTAAMYSPSPFLQYQGVGLGAAYARYPMSGLLTQQELLAHQYSTCQQLLAAQNVFHLQGIQPGMSTSEIQSLWKRQYPQRSFPTMDEVEHEHLRQQVGLQQSHEAQAAVQRHFNESLRNCPSTSHVLGGLAAAAGGSISVPATKMNTDAQKRELSEKDIKEKEQREQEEKVRREREEKEREWQRIQDEKARKERELHQQQRMEREREFLRQQQQQQQKHHQQQHPRSQVSHHELVYKQQLEQRELRRKQEEILRQKDMEAQERIRRLEHENKIFQEHKMRAEQGAGGRHVETSPSEQAMRKNGFQQRQSPGHFRTEPPTTIPQGYQGIKIKQEPGLALVSSHGNTCPPGDIDSTTSRNHHKVKNENPIGYQPFGHTITNPGDKPIEKTYSDVERKQTELRNSEPAHSQSVHSPKGYVSPHSYMKPSKRQVIPTPPPLIKHNPGQHPEGFIENQKTKQLSPVAHTSVIQGKERYHEQKSPVEQQTQPMDLTPQSTSAMYYPVSPRQHKQCIPPEKSEHNQLKVSNDSKQGVPVIQHTSIGQPPPLQSNPKFSRTGSPTAFKRIEQTSKHGRRTQSPLHVASPAQLSQAILQPMELQKASENKEEGVKKAGSGPMSGHYSMIPSSTTSTMAGNPVSAMQSMVYSTTQLGPHGPPTTQHSLLMSALKSPNHSEPLNIDTSMTIKRKSSEHQTMAGGGSKKLRLGMPDRQVSPVASDKSPGEKKSPGSSYIESFRAFVSDSRNSQITGGPSGEYLGTDLRQSSTSPGASKKHKPPAGKGPSKETNDKPLNLHHSAPATVLGHGQLKAEPIQQKIANGSLSDSSDSSSSVKCADITASPSKSGSHVSLKKAWLQRHAENDSKISSPSHSNSSTDSKFHPEGSTSPARSGNGKNIKPSASCKKDLSPVIKECYVDCSKNSPVKLTVNKAAKNKATLPNGDLAKSENTNNANIANEIEACKVTGNQPPVESVMPTQDASYTSHPRKHRKRKDKVNNTESGEEVKVGKPGRKKSKKLEDTDNGEEKRPGRVKKEKTPRQEPTLATTEEGISTVAPKKRIQTRATSEIKQSMNNTKIVAKVSVAKLKRSGEPFLQNGPCFEVCPNLVKCRECRMRSITRNAKLNIFCRFYAFRRLKYGKSGTLVVAGFSDPSDCKSEDLEPWLPQTNKNREQDLEVSQYILSKVGDEFCELVMQEREAQAMAAKAAKIAWKKSVAGVREMCDICETTLFNIHWVCEKCGFVVCLDCYNQKRNEPKKEIQVVEEQNEITVRKNKKSDWVFCSSKTPHVPENLMVTQIIPGKALWTVGAMLHKARGRWGIEASCPCAFGEHDSNAHKTENKPANGTRPTVSQLNGVSQILFADATDNGPVDSNNTAFTNNSSKLCKPATEKFLANTRLQTVTPSPLDFLAEIATSTTAQTDTKLRLNKIEKTADEKKNKMSVSELFQYSYEDAKAVAMTAGKVAAVEGDDTEKRECVTLRELLTKTAGRLGKPTLSDSVGFISPVSAVSDKTSTCRTVTGTFEDIIATVVEQNIALPKQPIVKDKPRDKAAKLKINICCDDDDDPSKSPIRRTLTESSVTYPGVPHSWLCDGRLLRLHDPTHRGNLKIFQEEWRRGVPVLVSNVHKLLNMKLWSPVTFAEEFGHIDNDLVNCRNDLVIQGAPMKDFWEGFEEIDRRLVTKQNEPMILKLKDWPPSEDFSEVIPDRFLDLMQCLPLPEYTKRDGMLNLASTLPDFFVRPDLGPKMYNAYGSAEYPKDGTTNLHLDVSDAVNVMVYVGIPYGSGPGQSKQETERRVLRAVDESDCDDLQRRRAREDLPGALWHIYSAKDTDKIRQFLKKVSEEQEQIVAPDHDPIHDQSWYLNGQLRERLLKEYGVRGWAITQCKGDAVFLPAGAPHQVRNLNSCVKVAEDFVSPEHIKQCFTLTQEFRHLSDTHSNHEDKLQVKNIIYHAIKDSVGTLLGEAPPRPDSLC